MTTTTDRPRPPAPITGARHLKLYFIALLATVYVVAWWIFGVRPQPPRAEVASRAEPNAGMATWIHDLPVAARPAVQVPPGWHISDRRVSASAAARSVPVPVRVTPSRPGRLRTRSS